MSTATRSLVGGPLCGAIVRFTRPELRVRLQGTDPHSVAVYVRDGDRYQWRRTVPAAELPTPTDTVVCDAVIARSEQPGDWDGPPWRQWRPKT